MSTKLGVATVIIKFMLAVIAIAATSTRAAQAADVTLTLSHFLSPKSATHAKFLAPWAKSVETQSKGRIKIEIFPSMALGGKPPELYRQVRDGAADLVWTLPGYTPGVFPRVEAFELFGVHQGSARATTLAIQESYDLVADDFKAIKPILVHVHAGQALHLVNGCISSVDDFAGRKLRTPSRTGGWMISSWGAEPVGMPVPALPQALSKGAVDGALIPFEIVPPLRVHEMTTCSVTGPDDARFGTAVFLFAMNKDRYEALPNDLKAVIDANSGSAIAGDVGALWDGNEELGRDLQRQTGSEVKALAPAVFEALKSKSETIIDRWIGEAEKAGFDGRALIAAARAAIAKNTN